MSQRSLAGLRDSNDYDASTTHAGGGDDHEVDTLMQPQQNPNSGDVPALAGDRSALARIENSLKDRQAELTRMMAEMRELCHSGRSQAQVEIESLRQEKSQIQQLVDKHAKELADLAEHSRAAEVRAQEMEQHYQHVLAEAEAALADQGDELARLVTEFKQAKTEQPDASGCPQKRGELPRVQEEHQSAQLKLASMAPTGELEKLRGELARTREELAEANRKASAAITMVPVAEAEKLRNELVRTREQLQEAKNKAAAAPAPAVPAPSIAAAELDNLQKELGRLKAELAQKAKALQASVPAGDVEKLIAELGRARGEVAKLQQNPPAAPNANEMDELRAELTILEEELHEKDRKLQELRDGVRAPQPKDHAEVAEYEAELISYHRQLEADRQTLNDSIKELEQRNAELTKAALKAQQDLAGERAQLTQLRDELHIDLAFEDLAFLARKHLAPIQPAKKK